ncbi:MAG: adenosylmethionine decarboxylase [Candidatus Bathyarchaeota archaeon]|jgi:S-adenosylmethionine decarboxylase
MLKLKQLLVDLYGCKVNLDDEKILTEILDRAAKRVDSTIVNTFVQRFTPIGVSIFMVLAETHLSIHTWPEHQYAALDIFVCGEGKDPQKAWDSIKEELKPNSYEFKELTRTIGGDTKQSTK